MLPSGKQETSRSRNEKVSKQLSSFLLKKPREENGNVKHQDGRNILGFSKDESKFPEEGVVVWKSVSMKEHRAAIAIKLRENNLGKLAPKQLL